MNHNEILKELNNVQTIEIECHLLTQENSHLLHDICAQNEDRFYNIITTLTTWHT